LPTCSFRDLARVCKALGLTPYQGKKWVIWKGISPINNQPVVFCIHEHAGGRDIAIGIFNSYIKQLGFRNFDEFNNYLKNCN
jgi:hypothetical protein